jgi:hypothetical protein
VILNRASQLLNRFRRRPELASAPSASTVAAPPSWRDEVAAAGRTADEWIARRLTEDALYVNVGRAHLERLRAEHTREVDSAIRAAERVVQHEFDLLGSGPYHPHDPDRSVRPNGYRPIDWYLDPVSGLRFPRGIPIAGWNLERMRPGRADVKLPWELARCQHWPLLGQAYQLTGDDRFAAEIASELDDFMEANPIGTAVNWACTMDIALRAANWSLGLELVRSSAALAPAFWHRAYDALFDHGTFIESHLENTYEVTSNHFLSNVVGLFFVAGVFDDLPRGRQWDGQCRAWLLQEMQVQVLPDGADYESSVPYHRLVAELFLGAARLAEHKRVPLPPEFMQRLRSMFEFLEAVLRPDGLMPQIGDADDGRLHIMSGYGRWQPQDGRHLFGPAGCLFDDASWRGVDGERGRWESAWWGFEPEPGAATSRAPRDLRHFPRAGLTVMRRGRDYLLVTNSVVGTGGFGNHKHNDQLGFEFHVAGTPLIVDPGTYVYTSDPDARNLFRSTASHNTIAVDGEEQNEFRRDWLFRMFEKADPEHVEIRDRDDLLIYRGRHRGYTRLSHPIVHERSFALSRRDGSLTIDDRLDGRGMHRVRWHFHFAPGVDVSRAEAGRFVIRAGDVSLELTAPPALAAGIGRAWYSPSYGVRVACLTLDLEADVQFDGHCEYRFRIAS